MLLKTNFYSIVCKWLQFIMVIFMLSNSSINYAVSQVVQESQVKAVFLYNFANFIRWPQTAFTSQHASFNICILGHDPFQQDIDAITENEQVNKRTVKIKRLSNIAKIEKCQILFISHSEAAYFTTILNIIRKYPILTVSDIDNFVTYGGMIQFFKHRKRIRFYIAPDTLKKTGLQANANLLRVAKIVR